jgi:predicted RNase H-like HicB family nuclease
MSEKRYPIVIERTATGFSAYSPDVPGCAAAGDTEEETRQSFRDALAAHFELMREIGDPVPEPSSSVDYVQGARRLPSTSGFAASAVTDVENAHCLAFQCCNRSDKRSACASASPAARGVSLTRYAMPRAHHLIELFERNSLALFGFL